MNKVEVLETVLGTLKPETWHQGGYVGGNNTYCLAGHVALATGATFNELGERFDGDYLLDDSVVNHLDRFIPAEYPTIASFNDSDLTSFEDVILVVKKALEDAYEHEANSVI